MKSDEFALGITILLAFSVGAYFMFVWNQNIDDDMNNPLLSDEQRDILESRYQTTLLVTIVLGVLAAMGGGTAVYGATSKTDNLVVDKHPTNLQEPQENTETEFCKKCGQKVSKSDIFCKKCGQKN